MQEEEDDVVDAAALGEDEDAETSDDEDEGDEEADVDAPSTSRQQREYVPEADDEDDGAPGFYVDEVVLDNFPQNMPLNVSEVSLQCGWESVRAVVRYRHQLCVPLLQQN